MDTKRRVPARTSRARLSAAASLLAAIFIFSVLGPSAKGAPSGFAAGDISGAPGETVTVPVTVSDNPGIAAFRLSLLYDNTRLTPEAIEPAPALENGTFTSNIMSGGDLSLFDDVTTVWFDASDMTDDGVLFTVRFKIGADAVGVIPLTLSYGEGDIANQRYEDVALGVTSGSVSVLRGTADGAPDSPTAPPAVENARRTPAPPVAGSPGAEDAAWINPFSDVPEDEWFHGAVRYVSSKALMNGVSPDTFAPRMPVSRAMFVTILHRAEGLPPASAAGAFRDVAAGRWYTDAIAWASENAIAMGCGDSFGVDDPITREQLAAMLYRLARRENPPDAGGMPAADPGAFTDSGDISYWARGAMAWAVAEGVITGRAAGELAPKGAATRAEAAEILRRYLERAEL